MARKTSILILAFVLSVSVIAGLTACGDEEEETTTQATAETATDENGDQDTTTGDSDDPFSEVENIEATVEVTVNGETTVIWSQKDGSWRWQNPDDPEDYVIYNDDEKKLWVVSDKVATESSSSGQDSVYWGMSPAGRLGMYAMLPGGVMSDDTFEVDVPGEGKIVVEFTGPQGLPSEFTVFDLSGNEKESIVFEYSDVGNVSSDLFELPSDVTIQSIPDVPEMPGGGSMPEIPDMPQM